MSDPRLSPLLLVLDRLEDAHIRLDVTVRSGRVVLITEGPLQVIDAAIPSP